MNIHSVSGECLNGSYFWGSDMVIIKYFDRDLIKNMVSDMIDNGIFYKVFS